MWTKPYGMKEGFLIGGGLILAGLMLEMSVGPVHWGTFRWPANMVVLCGMLLTLAIVFALRGRIHAFRFIGTASAAVPALAYAVILTAVMGLTRQRADGAGLNNMLTFWPFVLIYVYMTVILSQVILRRLAHFRWKRDIPFMLSHLGLFIALVCGTLGNADMQRLKMITVVGEPEWRALGPLGTVVELPLAIELKQFVMETYDDGTPKRFASDILVHTQGGKSIKATVDVNKPATADNWKIYQYGYDTNMGAQSNTSILELVSDPWQPLVYTGIWMMLAGAVCMLVFGVRRKQHD